MRKRRRRRCLARQLQILANMRERRTQIVRNLCRNAAHIRNKDRDKPQRIGITGLGAGVMLSYSRAGDYYRIYEINPLVLDVAKKEFTFIKDSPAELDIIMGDARLSLEREAPQNFDVLHMDAFSSDSVPVHLLTKEADRKSVV